jgi:N-acyl-phosphatidylethanolamine-hydrolysing phospholipase D
VSARGLAAAALLLLAGCVRPLGVLAVFARNAAALVSPVRRLPARITRPARADARLAVLWVGHATVLVQLDDRFVLTDPVFTSAVGQVSPRLVEPGIDPAHLPRLDAVIVSHTHFDHLSQGSIELVAPRAAQLLVPSGALAYVPDVGVPATELPTWTYWERDGLRVTAVPVEHGGWRYGADAAWMGAGATAYVVEYHGLTVYFGGDSAYAPRAFRATAERFPRIDLALLPIAPIEPRAFLGRFHMDPPEALAAFRDLRARRMVPIHFDTFVNSSDRVGDAPDALRRAMIARGVGFDEVALLAIGEQRVIVPLPGPRDRANDQARP